MIFTFEDVDSGTFQETLEAPAGSLGGSGKSWEAPRGSFGSSMRLGCSGRLAFDVIYNELYTLAVKVRSNFE